MDIITLLEKLANSTHTVNISELIGSQSLELQQAFLSKDTSTLRSLIGNTKNLADRSTVTQITI